MPTFLDFCRPFSASAKRASFSSEYCGDGQNRDLVTHLHYGSTYIRIYNTIVGTKIKEGVEVYPLAIVCKMTYCWFKRDPL